MHPKLPLPRGWKDRVRSSVLHILALSHYTFTALLARAAQSKNRQFWGVQYRWTTSHKSNSTRSLCG